MNPARIGLAAAIVVALLVTVPWIVPAVVGPFAVECGELEPAVCDQAWRQVASEQSGHGPPFFPITGVRIGEATAETPLCGTFIIERWIFAESISNHCG